MLHKPTTLPCHPLLPLCPTHSYQRIARCQGHSSYIRHVDWSADSRVLQTSCGAYELLYFDAATGKQVRRGRAVLCCTKRDLHGVVGLLV
jgi:hypothetical protein